MSLANPPDPRAAAIVGCILGTAVGDALGLPYEGLSRRRQRRLAPTLDGYRMLLGRGLTSDDTEHTCMLAQSLIKTAGQPPETVEGAFLSDFAWRLRFWLLMLPAGIGWATLRAIGKLLVGFSARTSGVSSAGNGPAMRVALIGVCYGGDPERMRILVHAATCITHRHPDAEHGALAVALAARFAAAGADVSPGEYLHAYVELTGADGPFNDLVGTVCDSVARGEDAEAFAESLGCRDGVSGYIRHTVPVVLHVWLRRQSEYRAGVVEVIRLGGDTDTGAAILGAIIGARVGGSGIPEAWLAGLWEWPRSVSWMSRLGHRLAARCRDESSGRALPVNGPALLVRNVLFMLLVLMHGFRRMFPPY